ncbi:MAG: outer membrane beta-barrel protein [Limimaricola sp.]|uniref:outer membrane protein n=1 Tax=Limimaricola sp. TaxID=2211665 RepID=UPI001D7F73EE|nr:outer membrane beta-barrel protein [Limimaricola sp.]MBI1417860.1 outer membrane beta-barrel protein [Limimaricola sp.]
MSENIVKDMMYFGTAALSVGGLMSAADQVQAQTWTGPYAGLSFGAPSGTADFKYGGTYAYTGMPGGAFAGYNMAMGDWVFGGEVAYTNGFKTDTSAYGEFAVSDLLDLRARAGRVFGSTFVYGALGASFGQASYVDSSYSASGSIHGTNVGVGFEMGLGDRATFGFDVTRRMMKYNSDISSLVTPGDLTTVSVRVGMRF